MLAVAAGGQDRNAALHESSSAERDAAGPNDVYQDISAGEWLAHTPSRLVNEHLKTGEEFVRRIAKQKAVVTPE